MTTITKTQRLRFVIVGSAKEWIHKRASTKGAALAFYTLFSLVPVLVLIITVAGKIFGPEAAQGEIFYQLKSLVGASGAETIQSLLASAHSSANGGFAAIVAAIVLIIAATTVFSELKDSLDELWYVPHTDQSGLLALIKSHLLSFAIILMLAVLLVISLCINAAEAMLEKYSSGFWDDIAFIVSPVSMLFSFLVLTSLFASIYKVLPDIRIAWRDVWIGAIGTALLFNFGKFLIGIYLSNSTILSSYGAANSLIALLLWVYYSAQVFFLGAAFTRQYALWYGSLCGSNEALKQLQAEKDIRTD
jgi:membrane protein